MQTPRPTIGLGQYILSKPLPTLSRCKAYNAPPPDGNYICTIDPSTYIGPIDAVVESEVFITIRCRTFWINIWKSKRGSVDRGISFAKVISREVSDNWCQRGWVHQPLACAPWHWPEPDAEPSPEPGAL